MAKKHLSGHLKKYYWGTNALWNRSYCLLSVGGAPIEVLKEYIEQQNRPKT
ncbi:transposase [Neptuniibacter sp. QD37_11]|uniref:transposase n=1 Tax=Neptuniibacter sp. QD37_11 TaxID=3398209 RepID=UPI0039F54B36